MRSELSNVAPRTSNRVSDSAVELGTPVRQDVVALVQALVPRLGHPAARHQRDLGLPTGWTGEGEAVAVDDQRAADPVDAALAPDSVAGSDEHAVGCRGCLHAHHLAGP